MLVLPHLCQSPIASIEGRPVVITGEQRDSGALLDGEVTWPIHVLMRFEISLLATSAFT